MVRLILCLLFLFPAHVFSQITGQVRDGKEPVAGATVYQKGTTNGASTDADGKFSLIPEGEPPYTIVVSFTGFTTQELTATKDSRLNIELKPLSMELKNVDVTGSRISEKQKVNPLTVETMDIIAIRECPQNSFYEGLGSMKGVDLTTASLGFTIVNTRGFNSTSPVRSLQLIDGVDNQSPGLNFSLGNFLGSPELDVLKVDMIAGASSAFYGPNAFNGVISMTTRSPFVKPGLEVSARAGERNLLEGSVRWAQVIKNKNGPARFGYKVNLYYMRANDWEADNMSPSNDSRDGASNPGRYDAVNRYGDEDITGAYNATSVSQQAQYPGLNRWYRTGYREKYIVDYNSYNIKLSAAFHYKIRPDVEAIVASNFGNGTTVYQGDNRYSLNDIKFYQNRIEIRKENKFFIRAYATNEDAGDSYDAVFTAILMQNAAKSDDQWGRDYRNYWINNHIFNRAHALPGFPPYQAPYDTMKANEVLAQYSDSVTAWHDGAESYANKAFTVFNHDFYEPGTARFDSLLKAVTSRKTFGEGGSGFYDKSALYHFQGEYQFNPSFAKITTGANYRLYRPDSRGTIFSDTSGEKIRSYEFGVYAGVNKNFGNFSTTLTLRMDKNKNFNYLFSPALSAVYTTKSNHVFRISFSAAIRNPTLSDQYLYYNVGRAILLGNISGYDSLATIESLRSYLTTPTLDRSVISYFNVDPVRPEKVKTIEAGYRGTLSEKIYVDLNYYFSFYTDFIGYRIGLDLQFNDPPFQDYLKSVQAYRVASNATDMVVSQGGSIGINYYFYKKLEAVANYSYNYLDRRGSDDPLIPAFNTPVNKFNVGVNGRDLAFTFVGVRIKNTGFNVNYKWIQGFEFEGSPQFTGFVESYGLVDAQLNYKANKIHSTFKVGVSNLLNDKVYQVYGGPLIGRLATFSIYVNLAE